MESWKYVDFVEVAVVFVVVVVVADKEEESGMVVAVVAMVNPDSNKQPRRSRSVDLVRFGQTRVGLVVVLCSRVCLNRLLSSVCLSSITETNTKQNKNQPESTTAQASSTINSTGIINGITNQQFPS